MSYLTKHLKQKAVYWERTGIDGYGTPTYATPIEINVRWIEDIVEILNYDGEEKTSNSQVLTSIDVLPKSMLWLGELDNLSVAEKADPSLLTSAGLVQKFNKVPNIKGTNFYREAFL